QLPQVELRLHLETSLRLRRLAERRRGASDPARHPPGWPALSPPSHIADPARFTGYDRLRRLRYLSRAGSIADEWYTSENIEQITYELLEEAQRQHIRYVEVRVGGRRGFALLGAPRMLDAMAHARAQAEARLGALRVHYDDRPGAGPGGSRAARPRGDRRPRRRRGGRGPG